MSTISAGTTSTTALVNTGDTTGNLVFQTNGTITAMTIDTSQNVGIGTSSPGLRLDVAGGDGSTFDQSISGGRNSNYAGSLLFKNSYWNSGVYGAAAIRGLDSGSSGGLLAFYTTTNGSGTTGVPTERMRIDSSGSLMVGLTGGNARLQALRPNTDDAPTFTATGPATASNRVANILSNKSGDSTSAALLISKFANDSTTNQTFVHFAINNNGITSGQINANGSNAAAFGTWSDARLKENIESLPPQLANICALRPVEFDYKAGGHQIGFIAQEMQEIYPDAVGENGDGMLVITGWGKTEARLVAAIQEQQAMITQLQAEVAALKGAK